MCKADFWEGIYETKHLQDQYAMKNKCVKYGFEYLLRFEKIKALQYALQPLFLESGGIQTKADHSQAHNNYAWKGNNEYSY